MYWTKDNDGPFIDQSYVDEYFEKTKTMALDVDTEEDAVKLLKRIKYLEYVSEAFFVPNEYLGWEEKALSYIESPDCYFKHVQYDIILAEHKNFFSAVRTLETFAGTADLSYEDLFTMVKEFNDNMDSINETCKKYHVMSFTKYWFQSKSLQSEYDEWIKDDC